jgi:hypothetical protein
MFANKARKSSDCGKPLIAGGDATAARCLDIGEKAADEVGRDILQVETVWRLPPLPGDEWNEQPKCIAIALLRVTCEVAFGDNMVQ